MKIHWLALWFLTIGIMFCFAPSTVEAKRTVRGTVTQESNGSPVAGARVRAWDYDLTSGDDFMGEDITDANGYYEIHYEGKHWDTAPHGITIWRPDIYVTVAVQFQGGWTRIWTSSTHSNWKIRNDLTINPRVTLPSPPQPPHCDHLISEMISCSYPWHGFYVKCTACAADGHRYTWKHWFARGDAKYYEKEQQRCNPTGTCD